MTRAQPAFQNEDVPDTLNRVGRRGAPRLRLAIPARLTALDGVCRCILIDLSQTGAQVSLETPLRQGADVLLQVAGLEPFGTVVRRVAGHHGGTNGIRFDEALHPDEVLAVRAYSESYQLDEQRALRREAHKWVMGT